VRKQHKWNVTLQRDDGEIVEYPLSAYWSPDFEGIQTVVGNTAQAQAYLESGKTHKFAPIAASPAA
jgi:hypothetical protein